MKISILISFLRSHEDQKLQVFSLFQKEKKRIWHFPKNNFPQLIESNAIIN